MAKQTEKLNKDRDRALRAWRQGDFALGVGLLYADQPEEGVDEVFAPCADDGVIGVVVVSQTCDIVNLTPDRRFVTVCPLVKVAPHSLTEIAAGRRPTHACLQTPPEEVIVADLTRTMSVSKDLLSTWERHTGFDDDRARRRFAFALERLYGRFAFPDPFVAALEKFRKRVLSKHNKDDSLPGRIYRSIRDIRVRAAPHWSADVLEIAFIVVLEDEHAREAEWNDIAEEIQGQISAIVLPDRYKWSKPPLVLGTADDLTARDVLESQLLDFSFLCLARKPTG